MSYLQDAVEYDIFHYTRSGRSTDFIWTLCGICASDRIKAQLVFVGLNHSIRFQSKMKFMPKVGLTFGVKRCSIFSNQVGKQNHLHL